MAWFGFVWLGLCVDRSLNTSRCCRTPISSNCCQHSVTTSERPCCHNLECVGEFCESIRFGSAYVCKSPLLPHFLLFILLLPCFPSCTDSVLFNVLAISSTQHRSEEHTSELQSLMRISYAVFCLKKKNKYNTCHTQ